jgi:hypothetical protein
MSNTAEELAGWLTSYADYRAEYLHGFDPQTANDLAKASENDLLIWAEIEGIRKAAKLITDPANNYIGLPSWRWDAWLAVTGNQPVDLS